MKSSRDLIVNPYLRTMALLEKFFGKKPVENELMPDARFLTETFELQEKIENRSSTEAENLAASKKVEEQLEVLNRLFRQVSEGDRDVYDEIVRALGKLKFLENLKGKIESRP